MKYNRSYSQFPSFMSEQKLSTRSKTRLNLKKIKIFPVFAGQETFSGFRHLYGHQRAGAITGSINSIQNTNITVYEVKSQKTVNTKA